MEARLKAPLVSRGLRFALPLLLAAQALVAGELEFVVIGDTRPHFQSEDFHFFESLLPRIHEAHPAFVINLGDLIYGYGVPSKNKQWDKYQKVVRTIQVPYYQVPGNHDTHSKEARKIYVRRFGTCYQSFDVGDCHFVLLDSTEEQRWGYLGATQVAWLKADLAKTRARSVFVFTHFPIWEPTRVAPQYYEFWRETLHPLFKASRVRAVFAGHVHTYGPTREFDGIQYFITGGGGAEFLPEYKKAGGEHHFIKVKVNGDNFDLRVVTPDRELTDLEADVMGGFAFADRHSSRVGINVGAQDLRAGVQFSISLQNPYPDFLVGKAEWVVDSSAFSVSPPTTTVRIVPGGTETNTFTIQALRVPMALGSNPRLEFNVASGGRRHRFHRDVLFLQLARTPYRAGPPTLDGQLADWEAIPAVQLGRHSSLNTVIRAAHDEDTLYLAITVPARHPATKAASVFPDELQLGFARRLNDTSFGGDFLRLGFSSALRSARNRTPGAGSGAMFPGVASACRVVGDQAHFEIGIPLRFLKHLRMSGTTRLILNLSFPSADDESEEDEAPDPAVNSFAYQVRFGGDSLMPVHFVELELEPGRRP
jgi:hypothetical protein